MTTPQHPAWSPPAPEWVTLAPGVRWLLRRPTGDEQLTYATQSAHAMRQLLDGRAVLEGAGFQAEEMGIAGDLEKLSGLAGLFAACLTAKDCLEAWEGIEEPDSGELLEISEETIRHALIYGPPPWGQPLLTPFLAWMESDKRQAAGEQARLRRRAKDAWCNGLERCRACGDEKSPCSLGGSEEGVRCPQQVDAPRTAEGERAWSVCLAPGMWIRAGMDGSVTGLDYRMALLAAEAAGGKLDVGVLFKCLGAIEIGRLEAEAERRAAESQTP